MKRIWIFLLTAIVLFTSVSPVLGAPGDTGDPVVSASYLDEVLKPQLLQQSQKLIDKGMNETYAKSFLQLAQTVGAHNLSVLQAGSGPRKTQGTVVLKKGDVLTVSRGTKITLLSGSITPSTKELVNVTAGTLAPSGTALKPKTLYMMGAADGALRVDTDTCELTLTGVYTIKASSGTDYGSLAQALNTMGLFQGTGTGYALEAGATRAQGLVMFLRILGLEQEALAYTGASPFRDVPSSHWASRYVAYAHAKGLTSGTSATAFSPEAAITAQHYVTFLLRALHYDEGKDFTYNTALTSAATLGLFTQQEMQLLSSGTFRRSGMVYLSYYGLFGVDQTAGTMLLSKLVADGTVKNSSMIDGICKVNGTRIS